MNLTRVGGFVVRHRYSFILIGLLTFILAGYAASQLVLRDDPNQWPPASDPRVRLNNRIQGQFGGGGLVSITVSVKSGDIFNTRTLAKIRDITQRLGEIDGVIPYTITSLSSLNTKYLRFVPGGNGKEDVMEVLPLMDPARPPVASQLERIKEGAYDKSTLAENFLFSSDGKSARIIADFRTIPFKDLPYTDPVAIYQAVQGIVDLESDGVHVIRATGTPIIIGWVNSAGLRYVGIALVFFIAMVGTTLWLSFRNIAGVMLPLVAGIWGTAMGFSGYRVFFGETLTSASALIAPFIIIAVGAFHAVQFLKRFFEQEMPHLHSAPEAAVAAFVARFNPMLVSLVADAMAFLVLAFVPFENVRVLGIVTVFGMLSVTLAEFFLILPALSYLSTRSLMGASKTASRADEKKGGLDRMVRSFIRSLVLSPRSQFLTVGFTGIVVVLAVIYVWGIRAGQDNTYAIHNYLTRSWEDNPIYKMEVDIRHRFGGVYPMTILVEARGETAESYLPLQSPDLLQKLDLLAAHLDEDPAVHGVAGLPMMLKAMNRFLKGGEDKEFVIPSDSKAIGEAFYFYTSGQPGAFDAYADPDFQKTVLTAFVEDTKRETVERLMEATRRYVDDNFNDARIVAHVAGGSIGIASAFNENIGKWLIIGSGASAILTLLSAGIMLRSVILPAILLIPLLVGTIIWLAVMRFFGIELNSNTVTSLAIASGIGIDAGVYCLYRFREELVAGSTSWNDALISSFSHIFRPLIASNAALILGCWALVPIRLYLGYVGFGMGLILLLISIASFVLLPVIWSFFKPATLAGQRPYKFLEASHNSGELSSQQ